MNSHSDIALCKKCRAWRPKTEFTRYTSGRLRSYCKACWDAYTWKRDNHWTPLRERRAALLRAGLMDCQACKRVKPASEFYQRKLGKAIHVCKECHCARSRRVYELKSLDRKRSDRAKAHAKMMRNPENRIKQALRNRYSQHLRRLFAVKPYSGRMAIDMIGCGQGELRQYIEAQFSDGMTWENYGTQWHIDHVMPLALVDPLDLQAVRRACHYTNLRPLWADENRRKKAKKPAEHQPLLPLLAQ